MWKFSKHWSGPYVALKVIHNVTNHLAELDDTLVNVHDEIDDKLHSRTEKGES